MAGREMFGNSKMPSNMRFRWELPPTFCRKTCRKRSDRLRIRRIPAKVYMSGNFDGFQKSLFERLLRETRGNRAEGARRFGGIRIHFAADLRNSAWNIPSHTTLLLRQWRLSQAFACLPTISMRLPIAMCASTRWSPQFGSACPLAMTSP